MAMCLFRSAVMPRRRETIWSWLWLRPPASRRLDSQSGGNDYVQAGAQRVSKEFDSQYRFGCMFPATILTTLYLIGFSLGMLLLAMKQEVPGRLVLSKLSLILSPMNNSEIRLRLFLVATSSTREIWSAGPSLLTFYQEHLLGIDQSNSSFSVGFAIAFGWSPLASGNKAADHLLHHCLCPPSVCDLDGTGAQSSFVQ